MGRWSCGLEANAVREGLAPAIFPCNGLSPRCPLPLLAARDDREIAITWSAKACLVADV